MKHVRYDDWLSNRREAQLAMAKDWVAVLTSQPSDKPPPPQRWSIPAETGQELGVLARDAEKALALAKSSERAAAINTMCMETFNALTTRMRSIKHRYFLKPPLTDEDFTSLGLNPPEIFFPIPTAQVEADITLPGHFLIELVDIRALGGDPPDIQSDYGVRMFWGLTGLPSKNDKYRITEAPKTGTDLPHSKFTRRKKELFAFDGDTGNTSYFCLRFENPAGQAGPFGPILKAVVP